ncbi:MAG: Lpg1974 family pore-forming outer membrane protein [Acidobacteriota bacterium]
MMRPLVRFVTPVLLSVFVVAAVPAAAGSFFFQPEVTYLDFDDADLVFAVDGEVGDTISTGRANRLDPDHEIGYRLALGYRWENAWDVAFRYGMIDSDDSGSVTNSRGVLFPTLTHAADTMGFGTAAVATSGLDTELSTVDLEAGYFWGDRKRNHGRVFFGVRAAWFEQEQLTSYFSASTSPFDLYTVDTDADWSAYGLRVGVEGVAALRGSDHWRFLGSLSVSGLDGDTDVDHHEIFTSTSASTLVDLHGDYSETHFVVEASLGVGFVVERATSTFAFEFGYEYASWGDLVTAQGFNVDANDSALGNQGQEDVTLQGAFLRFRWEW